MIVFGLLIYLAQTIAGFLLLHLIWDVREFKALLLKFFLGAGMGAGSSSFLYFLWRWLNLPASIYPFFEAMLLVVLVIIVWQKESAQDRQKRAFNVTGLSTRTLLWIMLMFAAVSFCILNFWFYAIAIPHGYYDAWAIWNAAARFIYGTDTGWVQLLSRNAWGNRDYPLLVPLNVVQGWLIAGSTLTRIPLSFSLFFMLSLIGLIFSSLFIARDFEQGALAAILFSSLPALALLSSFQYADIQLSYFFLATGVLLYLYTANSDVRFLALAGLFAGFSGWTKNEGQMFLVISLLVCLILSIQARKNLFKYFLAGLLIPVIVILLFKSIAPPNDLFVDQAKSFEQLFDVSRYQLILGWLGQEFVLFGYWPISFFGVLLLYIFLVWRKPVDIPAKRWIPLFLFLFQFAGYFLIYLITPHDLIWHLNTSLTRLIFHILPLIIFWLFSILPSPTDIFAEKLLQNDKFGSTGL